MDLIRKLEAYRERERKLKWEGTFSQYFELVVKNPALAQLSHERIYNMIIQAGTNATPQGLTHYSFFDGEIFGLERSLQQLMEYLHSAAQRLEVRKRILLLMGPVGGGKSTIVTLLKRGLEEYSRTEQGAIYGIKGCPMHEEPLHLIPKEMREEVQNEFNIYIEGELCPKCRWMVDNTYNGAIENIPVERVLLSEKNRTGVGTFTPSDPKCVTGDTLVLTDTGLHSMEDLYQSLPQRPNEDEFVPFTAAVYGCEGTENSAMFYYGGFQPIFEVETEYGFTIRGTANHPLLTQDANGARAWVKIGDLQQGDTVLMTCGSQMYGQTTSLPNSAASLARKPEAVTAELAKWLGEFLASGVPCACQNTLCFSFSSQKEAKEMTDTIMDLFGATGSIDYENPLLKVVIKSPELLQWLKDVGVDPALRSAPPFILTAPKDIQAAFIEGVFAHAMLDYNGATSELRSTFLEVSFARHIQIMLLNAGVISELRVKDAQNSLYTLAVPEQHLEALYSLAPSLQSVTVTYAYASNGGRQSAPMIAQNTAAHNTDKLTPLTAQSIRPAGIERVYDLLVPQTHSFTADGFMQHNSQDISELVGGIDLSTIGEVGAESDPRAYRFDGELNVANRGLVEFIEILKADEKFLYVLLTLSQEQNIKTGRFSMIYADEMVISHTNESEYQTFVGNRKSEALQDRIILIKMPYNLRVSDETKIYEKLLKQSALKGVHIAPHTLRIASIFAILTRLEESKKQSMTKMKKLKVYDGEEFEDFKSKDIRELQEEAIREGMDGISPRYVINSLSAALVKDNVTCINAIDALRALRDGLEQHTGINRETREQYLEYISEARREYDEMVKKEVQRAFVYSYEESARNLLNNYLDNVEAFCNKTKVRDPLTDEDMDPDEKLMRSIEEQIGVSGNAAKGFREEILIRISSLARRGQKFDYNSHERLKEAIEKKLFADMRDVVKITTSVRTPDPEQLKRINEVVHQLIDNYHYCPVCANELLRYAGNLLNR